MLQAKTPDESAVEEIVYKIFPNDLNRFVEQAPRGQRSMRLSLDYLYRNSQTLFFSTTTPVKTQYLAALCLAFWTGPLL